MHSRAITLGELNLDAHFSYTSKVIRLKMEKSMASRERRFISFCFSLGSRSNAPYVAFASSAPHPYHSPLTTDMARDSCMAGNWKMNPTSLEEATTLAKEVCAEALECDAVSPT